MKRLFVPVTISFYFCFGSVFCSRISVSDVCYLQFIYYPMKVISPVYYYCFPPSCSQAPLCRVDVIGFGKTDYFFQKFILLLSLIQRHRNILLPFQLYEVMLISSDRCNVHASQLFISSISAYLVSDMTFPFSCLAKGLFFSKLLPLGRKTEYSFP